MPRKRVCEQCLHKDQQLDELLGLIYTTLKAFRDDEFNDMDSVHALARAMLANVDAYREKIAQNYQPRKGGPIPGGPRDKPLAFMHEIKKAVRGRQLNPRELSQAKLAEYMHPGETVDESHFKRDVRIYYRTMGITSWEQLRDQICAWSQPGAQD
jgi:hypothetical protein